ncbi:hypothetical protein [Cellulomonas iranensis]|uniref:Uncharacterized protein n=1 Tax=Cellulomonas iranensis TaxID=76862 RepID=A0ABU0GH96_9CELL|nr:hypothetical protein [Cellulomonas iranensis]MDQ0423967.1 hypothetical protein [Cellulomonas iranensis]UCN13524.1 hypothetical protein LFM56_11435 [Cellulomonas iranensis]
MGRHAGRDAAPRPPWARRLADGALRWAGHLVLGALAGGVTSCATLWAGTSAASARLTGLGTAAVVTAAAALARTVPAPPPAAAPRTTPGTHRPDPSDAA